jgi:site-specific DNA-cytosine methylase
VSGLPQERERCGVVLSGRERSQIRDEQLHIFERRVLMLGTWSRYRASAQRNGHNDQAVSSRPRPSARGPRRSSQRPISRGVTSAHRKRPFGTERDRRRRKFALFADTWLRIRRETRRVVPQPRPERLDPAVYAQFPHLTWGVTSGPRNSLKGRLQVSPRFRASSSLKTCAPTAPASSRISRR